MSCCWCIAIVVDAVVVVVVAPVVAIVFVALLLLLRLVFATGVAVPSLVATVVAFVVGACANCFTVAAP